VAREVISAGEQCRLVDRGSDDAIHVTRERHCRCALDCQATQPARQRHAACSRPIANRFVDLRAAAVRADHHKIRTPADP